MRKLTLVCVLVTSLFHFARPQEDGSLIYLGKTYRKALFAMRGASLYNWMEAQQMCMVRGTYMASIESQAENDIATRYLNSTDIELQNKTFWIAATDFTEEGTYRWARTSEVVNYSNWENEYGPEENREKNCVILNGQGQWLPERCAAASNEGDMTYSMPLCEIPLMPYRDQGRVDNTAKLIPTIPRKHQIPIPDRLKYIGKLGRKVYYADDLENGEVYYTTALNLCHSAGMKVFTPENAAEMQFFQEYSEQLAENMTDPNFWTSATAILSVGCGDTYGKIRTFYGSTELAEEIPKIGDPSAPHCVYCGPTACSPTSCQGSLFRVLCELVEDGIPPNDDCGIIGHDSGSVIRNEVPLNSTLPTGEIIWRGELWNVNLTATSNHPHNIYLTGFRQGTNYWFSTTDAYNNFIDEQGTNTISRRSHLYCLNGTSASVVYNFEFSIQNN